MTNAIKTAEFWTALVANIVGLVVLFGGVTQDQGTELTKQLQIMAGAIMSVLSTLGYVRARTDLKSEVVSAVAMQQANAAPLTAQDAGNKLIETLKDAGV